MQTLKNSSHVSCHLYNVQHVLSGSVKLKVNAREPLNSAVIPVGCSQRGHKIVHLAIKKGDNFCISLLKSFFAEYCHLNISSCISVSLYLCELSDSLYSA